jgi:hypothetical protein
LLFSALLWRAGFPPFVVFLSLAKSLAHFFCRGIFSSYLLLIDFSCTLYHHKQQPATQDLARTGTLLGHTQKFCNFRLATVFTELSVTQNVLAKNSVTICPAKLANTSSGMDIKFQRKPAGLSKPTQAGCSASLGLLTHDCTLRALPGN